MRELRGGDLTPHLALVTPGQVETVGVVPAHAGLALTTLVRPGCDLCQPYLVYIMAASLVVLVAPRTLTVVAAVRVDTVTEAAGVVTECCALPVLS